MLNVLVLILLTCGSERWNVKTLQDGVELQMSPNNMVMNSISGLVSLPHPIWNSKLIRQPIEKMLYRINAFIIAHKLEADSDIHIVLLEDSNAWDNVPIDEAHLKAIRVNSTSMIAEIPDLQCTKKAKPAYRAMMQQSRQAFVNRFGLPTNKITWLPNPVKVRAKCIPFFDKLHGQTGVAKNGIECHPFIIEEFL